MKIFDLRYVIAYDDDIVIEDNDNNNRVIYCDPWGRIPITLLDFEVLRIYADEDNALHIVISRSIY